MRIGELATRTGASVRSLRYYEEQGLLASTRSSGGQRHYTDHEVERVLFLQRLYAAGLSSRTIEELLPCVDSPSEENSDAAVERMAQELALLEEHIRDLVRTKKTLKELLENARTHNELIRAAGAPGERGSRTSVHACDASAAPAVRSAADGDAVDGDEADGDGQAIDGQPRPRLRRRCPAEAKGVAGPARAATGVPAGAPGCRQS